MTEMMPESPDPLSKVTLYLELSLTRYPYAGAPEMVCSQAYSRITTDLGLYRILLPDDQNPAYPLTLDLSSVCPAHPGWVSSRVTLLGPDSAVLGERWPVTFYGRPSEHGSHLYFPGNSRTKAAYSVRIRVTSGGLP